MEAARAGQARAGGGRVRGGRARGCGLAAALAEVVRGGLAAARLAGSAPSCSPSTLLYTCAHGT